MAGVTLTAATPGVDCRGGQEVANAAHSRPLTALKSCRKMPTVPTAYGIPHSAVLDEVDNGNGTRAVRLRLSRYVYQGDVATLDAGGRMARRRRPAFRPPTIRPVPQRRWCAGAD